MHVDLQMKNQIVIDELDDWKRISTLDDSSNKYFKKKLVYRVYKWTPRDSITLDAFRPAYEEANDI